MPAYASANSASTTLSATINNAVTTLTVASAGGFPTTGSYVVMIESELLLVTGGQGTTTWTVVRGVEGSSAAGHTTPPTITITLIWTTGTLLSWGGGDSAGGAPGYWPTLSPQGLSGATALTRYVGGTNSGSPVAGTFGPGDFVIDRTGNLYICVVTGTPGTWSPVRGGLLTSFSYGPPGGAAYGIVNNALNTALDPTNLTFSFVAPASGKVIIALNISGFATGPTNWLFIALILHGATTLIGARQMTAAGSFASFNGSFAVSGLNPGDTFQYDIGANAQTNAGAEIEVDDGQSGLSYGPCVVTVIAG